MKRLLTAIALSCCATFAIAASYEDGLSAHRTGDYAKALRIFEELSAKGYSDADRMLSMMYANGDGVSKDDKRSQELAIRAIEHGNEYAYGLAAALTFSEKSELFNPAKGMEWLQKGVKAGDIHSMRRLAYFKARGEYTALDKEGAFSLLKQCVEQQFGFCTLDLAEMYEKGVGIQQSYGKALRLYQSIRADDGSTDFMLGRMFEEGHGTTQNYERAMEHYITGAKKQNGAAMNRIGELYLHGHGIERDYMQAAYWFQQAANFHDADGLINGGKLFANGLGVKRDDAEAEAWYVEAVEKENSDAMRTLARFYEEGRGVAASPARARQLFCNAALNDRPRTLLDLSSSALAPTARRAIVGDLAVLYHCKESEQARKFAAILAQRLTQAERDEAQSLAGTFKEGSIGKSLDTFTGAKQ